MALKAYKHLTDGEVKIVEEDSAEEAGILADVVHGASYIELQTDGSREEVAAAQGDALWEDVSDELGGGSSFDHLTEDAENSYIEANWPIISEQALGGDFAFSARIVGDPDTGPGSYRIAITNDARIAFNASGDIDGTTYLENPSFGVLTIAGSPIFASAHLTDSETAVIATDRLTSGDNDGVSAHLDNDGSFTSSPVAASIFAAYSIIVPTENDYRWYRGGDGAEHYGNGTDAQDVHTGRDSAGNWFIENDNGRVVLGVDIDGDLTVGGTKVQLQA